MRIVFKTQMALLLMVLQGLNPGLKAAPEDELRAMVMKQAQAAGLNLQQTAFRYEHDDRMEMYVLVGRLPAPEALKSGKSMCFGVAALRLPGKEAEGVTLHVQETRGVWHFTASRAGTVLPGVVRDLIPGGAEAGPEMGVTHCRTINAQAQQTLLQAQRTANCNCQVVSVCVPHCDPPDIISYVMYVITPQSPWCPVMDTGLDDEWSLWLRCMDRGIETWFGSRLR